jgi:hypothetical protein
VLEDVTGATTISGVFVRIGAFFDSRYQMEPTMSTKSATRIIFFVFLFIAI